MSWLDPLLCPLSALAEQYGGLAVVLVLTGVAPDEGGLVEAFTAGATDFLIKPIKPALLRARVKGWLLRQ